MTGPLQSDVGPDTRHHVFICHSSPHSPSPMSSQTETHVQLRVNRHDIEMESRRPSAESLPDPYMFRVGLKSDDELSQLRRRHKHGKSLESYHRRQNNVRAYTLSSLVIHPNIAAHSFPPQINGRPHQRSQRSRTGFSALSTLPCLSRLYKPHRASPIQIKIAIWASLVANFTLCVLQRASPLKASLF